MIKINQPEQLTEVFCTKNKSKATVVISNGTSATPDGAFVLKIQEIVGTYGISDPVDKKDVQPIPKVEIHFFRPESIDVLIGQLERIKAAMNNPTNWLCMAC